MFDLNRLYSRHQTSLMRASTAASSKVHAEHLAEAVELARRIVGLQLTSGAGAASMWDQDCLSKNPPFIERDTSFGSLA